MKSMANITILTVLMTCGASVAAQEALPTGVGVYGYGSRMYAPQTHGYNDNGERESLGERFSHNFNGANLLDGVGGDDLAKLARQLKKFDANSTSSNSLLNTLDLGKLQVDVKGQVNVQVLGLGFGFHRYITGFVAVPWATAKVDVDVQYVNKNNVNEIRQRLGELAFEDLKSGLDRAANIDTQMILDSLEKLGYADMRKWEYTGLGDIVTGGVYSRKHRWTRGTDLYNVWRMNLSFPTGYYDDPAVLNDVNIGRGYHVLTTEFNPTFAFRGNLNLDLKVAYGYGLPTQVDKRVPLEDETLVAPDRLTSVELKPGADLAYGAGIALTAWPVKPGYHLGVSQHTRDQYSGTLAGNYDALSKGSDTYELFHEVSLGFDTTKAYQNNKFPVPVLGLLRAHVPIAARNSLDNRYIEFGIASFFKTPYGSSDSKTFAKAKKSKRSNQLAHRKSNTRTKQSH